jgi:hypothetical protein
VRDVPADLDVAEEPAPRIGGGLLEDARDRLDLRMIGRDAPSHEAPGRCEALEEMHLGVRARLQQMTGRVEAGRPGSDDGDAHVRAAR